MMFQQPFFFAFILLSFGCYCCCCEAATTPKDVISDDEDANIVQYKISRFGIVLEPTIHKITDDLVASLLSPVIEATLFDALGGEHTQSTYVLLTPAFVEDGDRRRQLSTTSTSDETTNSSSNSTTIIVKGGLVNFRTQPPTGEVLGVIRAGINENLVSNLPGNSAFQGITAATFFDLKDKEETEQLHTVPPVLVSPNTNDNDNDNGNSEQPSISTSDVLFVVFGTTGLLLLLSGLVLLTRRKERNQDETKSLKDISFETQDTNDTTSQQDTNDTTSQQQQQQQYDDDDNKSVNSTETENNQYLVKSHYLAAEESFERNSLMAVKKDMLQSEWSTYHPSNTNTNTNIQQMGDMKFQAASENDNHNNNAKGIV
jgi:Sec-independent protein translocase protein TatA